MGKRTANIIIAKSKDHEVQGIEGHVWVNLDDAAFRLDLLDYDPIAREKELKADRKKAGVVQPDDMPAEFASIYRPN